MEVANLMQPMSKFDPAEPALLHDRLNDAIIPWTGEFSARYRQLARRQADGTVSFDGLTLDGWDEPLGG